MAKAWVVAIERALMDAGSPAVLTTAMIQAMATAGREDAPSRATLARWLAGMREAGKLREVSKGVYLNVLGHRAVSPAAAAYWVRFGSVVSLSWVLEQGGITNNFGDTVTCVIPSGNGWPAAHVGDVQTSAAPFRFFAMPARLLDERAGKFADIQDTRFNYRRATLEKALLDWIYLGASPHSRMTRPPLDIDFAALDARRLRRLAKRMSLGSQLEAWMDAFENYQAEPDVQANAATELRL